MSLFRPFSLSVPVPVRFDTLAASALAHDTTRRATHDAPLVSACAPSVSVPQTESCLDDAAAPGPPHSSASRTAKWVADAQLVQWVTEQLGGTWPSSNHNATSDDKALTLEPPQHLKQPVLPAREKENIPDDACMPLAMQLLSPQALDGLTALVDDEITLHKEWHDGAPTTVVASDVFLDLLNARPQAARDVGGHAEWGSLLSPRAQSELSAIAQGTRKAPNSQELLDILNGKGGRGEFLDGGRKVLDGGHEHVLSGDATGIRAQEGHPASALHGAVRYSDALLRILEAGLRGGVDDFGAQLEVQLSAGEDAALHGPDCGAPAGFVRESGSRVGWAVDFGCFTGDVDLEMGWEESGETLQWPPVIDTPTWEAALHRGLEFATVAPITGRFHFHSEPRGFQDFSTPEATVPSPSSHIDSRSSSSNIWQPLSLDQVGGPGEPSFWDFWNSLPPLETTLPFLFGFQSANENGNPAENEDQSSDSSDSDDSGYFSEGEELKDRCDGDSDTGSVFIRLSC
ncbi:hypothetical protein K438DRAFT_2036949 [Mycena galopus ATCC 62051]|nr:hypothetical protein K438DRAFT_2036949 [Mycena galopus ATCC 62051]